MVAGDRFLETTGNPLAARNDNALAEAGTALSSRNGTDSLRINPLQAEDTHLAPPLSIFGDRAEQNNPFTDETMSLKEVHDRTITLPGFSSLDSITITPNLSGDVPNYLNEAIAHFKHVTDGHLFRGQGGSGKVDEYIDQMIAWNDQQVKDGLQGPGHQRIADALYNLARVYEQKRTGSAAKLSQADIDERVEQTVALLGDPATNNNQRRTIYENGLPCCTSSSLNYYKQRQRLDAAADQIASVLTTGQWQGRSKHVSFTTDELKNSDYWGGVTAPNYILAATDYKLVYGANYRLTPQSPGMRYDQAAKNYYQATGDQLPINGYDRSGMKLHMFYQPDIGIWHSVVYEKMKDHKTGRYVINRQNWAGGFGEGIMRRA